MRFNLLPEHQHEESISQFTMAVGSQKLEQKNNLTYQV
jgi:hypothetical protein